MDLQLDIPSNNPLIVSDIGDSYCKFKCVHEIPPLGGGRLGVSVDILENKNVLLVKIG
jgi:hypothetical protein